MRACVYVCVSACARFRLLACVRGVFMLVPACSLAYPECNAYAPYCIFICGLSGSTPFFRHYLINSTIFGKTLLNIKYVFWFSLQLLSEIFILRRIHQDIVVNVETSSCKVPVVLVGFELNLNFLDIFSKQKTEISNFIKIRPVGDELFHANRDDEANSRFSQFYERA